MKRYIQQGVATPVYAILSVVWLFLIIAPVSAGAAEQTDWVIPGDLQKVLESKIEEVSAATAMDEQTKATLTELYRRALTNLNQAQNYQSDADLFTQARQSAPAETEKIRLTLEKREEITPETVLDLSEDVTQSELETLLEKERADLAAVEAKLSDIKKRLENQVNRPAVARDRLIAAQRELEEVNAELNRSAPPDETAEMKQARKWEQETRAHALSNEIKKLDNELLSHQARVRLLEAKRDLAEYNVNYVSTRVQLLENRLSKSRLEEAEQVQQEAEAVQEKLKEKHPLIQNLAENNVALSDRLKTTAQQLESITSEYNEARENTSRLREELNTVKQKLEVAGLSEALGRVLMEQRRSLPELASIRQKAREREQLIVDAGLRQIQYGEELRKLRDIDSYIDQLTKDLPPYQAYDIESELRELITTRVDLLKKAVSTEGNYLRALGELELAQRQLIDIIESYSEYLRKRLLWIRSIEPVSLSMLDNLPDEVGRLLSPANWYQTVRDLARQLTDNYLMSFGVVLLGLLTLLRRRFLKKVVSTGEDIRQAPSDNFIHTLMALMWTALAAAPLPLLLMLIGWLLVSAPDISEFSNAVGVGLMRFSHEFIILLFFADICIPDGLAARHLRWPVNAVRKIHQELSLLMVLFLPALFIVVHSVNIDRVGYGGGLAVLVVLFAIGSIGFFIIRVFTPRGGVIADFLASHPASALNRLRPLWLGGLVALTVGMMILVLMGYLYTGATLTRNLIDMLWLIFFLVLVHSLVVRWLLIVGRRLVVLQAFLHETGAEKAAQAKPEKTGGDEAPEVNEHEVDIVSLNVQSQKLLNTVVLFAGVIGLWLIWAPVLPAFGILEDVSLWHQTEIVDGVPKSVPVTLADMALAIIVIIVTIAAARGLPAILEFILLQRISITPGARYTAATLLRYSIFAIGIIVFFTFLGGSWSQIQWLVAALGVGIGFGLQEIVANFISGLIILFERPIRVGDIVTVGNTTGTVTRIQIRATTITNWDRQELLVPNKEFITGRLLNWTLSDSINRANIQVGIAYGSDVKRALELMKEAADEHENVLDDPAPLLTFDNFGDNTLNLQLRAYLPSMEHRLQTITELNEAINRKFKEAGITIAFPQRDVHLDSVGPINVRLHRD